jgi:hypothetical protein
MSRGSSVGSSSSRPSSTSRSTSSCRSGPWQACTWRESSPADHARRGQPPDRRPVDGRAGCRPGAHPAPSRSPAPSGAGNSTASPGAARGRCAPPVPCPRWPRAGGCSGSVRSPPPPSRTRGVGVEGDRHRARQSDQQLEMARWERQHPEDGHGCRQVARPHHLASQPPDALGRATIGAVGRELGAELAPQRWLPGEVGSQWRPVAVHVLTPTPGHHHVGPVQRVAVEQVGDAPGEGEASPQRRRPALGEMQAQRFEGRRCGRSSSSASRGQASRCGDHGSRHLAAPSEGGNEDALHEPPRNGKVTFAQTPASTGVAPSRVLSRCVSHRSTPRLGTTTSTLANGSRVAWRPAGRRGGPPGSSARGIARRRPGSGPSRPTCPAHRSHPRAPIHTPAATDGTAPRLRTVAGSTLLGRTPRVRSPAARRVRA